MSDPTMCDPEDHTYGWHSDSHFYCECGWQMGEVADASIIRDLAGVARVGGRQMSDDFGKQREEWEAFAREQEAKGVCPHSGETFRVCWASCCDCFDYPEPASQGGSGNG